MTTTTSERRTWAPGPRPVAPRPHRLARWGILRDLHRPSDVVRHLGPNWYASIMGTGIVANAAATLPVQFPGLRAASVVVWALAAVLLLGLTTAWATHWIRHREAAKDHANDPVMAQFYGAPPMALLTIGTGTLLVGRTVVGTALAVDIDWVLWVLGTVTGLATSVAVPYLMFTRHELRPDSTYASWLMPVVPPMVSAAAGALLVPHTPAGQLRLTMLLACYAMFGLSLLASVITFSLVWSRLAFHKIGPERMVPTLWIGLGPLGQSMTAAGLLGGVASQALPGPDATGFAVFGLLYGVAVWGFAALWAALATAVTIRTVRRRLPFALTWWSFTFPVGTYVTGTSGLAVHTEAAVFRWVAVVLYAGLVAVWATVTIYTGRDSLRGRIFLPAPVPDELRPAPCR